AGETLGMVGESGSGKSTIARALTGQLKPPFRPDQCRLAGRALLDVAAGPVDLVAATAAQRRAVRMRDIAMISQDALSGLNPVLSIGWQLTESLRVNEPGLTRAEARIRATALLDEVELPAPDTALRRFPHQFSGGQRQRVMMALALARNPRLLIADEPTTALDATVQARILDLLQARKAARGMAVLFITHDLGVVSRIADRVAVLYAGRIAETCPVRDFRDNPRHPYTAGLVASRPGYHGGYPALTGYGPSPRGLDAGCAFRPRCPRAEPACAAPVPVSQTDRGDLACRRPL
ncbi:MAG: ABC transporter ATP-binding protein, partial [Gemmobacter sp.]|nr:ABC transporter ATP-binding protein [Gemmobacter sp.]